MQSLRARLSVQALQREQELQLWRQIIERSPSGREMLLPESAAALACESFRTAIEYGDRPRLSADECFQRHTCVLRLGRGVSASACGASLDVPSAVHARTASVSCLHCVFRNKCSCFLLKLRQRNAIFWKRLQEAGVQVSAALEQRRRGEIAILRDMSSMVLRMNCAWQPNGRANSWRRHPIARIGVILFDLERKLPQVESAFRSVLHPEHLLGQKTASAFEIASPRALAEYPVVRCALHLLSLFAAPIEFHCFHSMLSSPYLAAEPDAVARFLGGIRKHARRQVSVEDLARWLQKSHDLPNLRVAMDALPKHSAFSSEQAAAYWADISRRILEAFGWPGGVPLNSEEFQCTESWRELLVSVSSLELLDWRTDFKGFVERLKRTAATQNFKPETLNAPVQIMDAAEAEGSIFDALWIGSASDDLWPDSPRLSPLVPVALLKAAGVALVGSPQAEARISRITSRLLAVGAVGFAQPGAPHR